MGNELRVHLHSLPASSPTGEPAVTRRPFALVSCLSEKAGGEGMRVLGSKRVGAGVQCLALGGGGPCGVKV